MYVTLEHAREAIWKRWSAPLIQRKVQECIGEIPAFLRQEPRAVLARQVATPNFEFRRFSAEAPKSGLKPVVIEYTGDKFCSRNRDKYLLAKMTFFHGRGRKGGDKLTRRRTIDFNRYDGKALCDVRTLWEEHFVDFHHRLLSKHAPGIATVDVTEWLSKMGGEPGRFWPRLLCLFICHGILFDNFHTEGPEAEFTRTIIRPAILETERRFGLRPLVVPLVPLASEKEAYWSWYPDRVESDVRSLMIREAKGSGSEVSHNSRTSILTDSTPLKRSL